VLPARCRQAHHQSTEQHEAEIDGIRRDKRFRNPHRGRREKGIHQRPRQRRTDHGATTKSQDRLARRHAGTVGEPLDERRDRPNVAEAQADTAEHAVAQVQEPDLVQPDTYRGDKKTTVRTDMVFQHKGEWAYCRERRAKNFPTWGLSCQSDCHRADRSGLSIKMKRIWCI